MPVSHYIFFLSLVSVTQLWGISLYGGFEGDLRVQQLSSSLTFSSNPEKAEEWFKYRIERPPPPDLKVAVYLFSKQIKKEPLNSLLLTRLALQLYYEVGPKGRLLWKWNPNDYSNQMKRIDWSGTKAQVKPVFDWVLKRKTPGEDSPDWLKKAVLVSELKIDTKEQIEKSVNQLKKTPELLAAFIVEQVYRNPDKFKQLLTELKKQKISVSPAIAEKMFSRWKSLTCPRLAGTLLSLENSVIEKRFIATRTATLKNPLWTGRQKMLISSLNKVNAKSESVANKLVSLAEQAQESRQAEMAANLARAAILWYGAGSDLGYTAVLRTKTSPALSSLPQNYKEELALDRVLIFMNRRSLGAFEGVSVIKEKAKEAGNNPLAKIFSATCCKNIAELRKEDWSEAEKTKSFDTRWQASFALLNWLKKIKT